MNFNDLNIIPEILKAIKEENYIEPTPIQQKAIPVILQKSDILGLAQTGTGKTAAFAIPTLQLLKNEKDSKATDNNIKALIITPTRELALQIYESFTVYGRYLDLKYGVVYGGVSQKPQEEAIRNGVDILVATPGRLYDLMNQGIIKLDRISMLILDEADQMLDMGFIHEVKKIIAKTPIKKQSMLFSATMPAEIAKMSRSILIDPIKIAVSPEYSTVDTVKQFIYFVDKENKKNLLLYLLKDKSLESVLIFTRTKYSADKVVHQLGKANIPAKAIHGDKSQNNRQNALKSFKDKAVRVLVATDIAARGIDIDELTHVINYDLPNVPETYIHRIGRTGRAGMEGTSISFCDINEKELLVEIEKLIRMNITVINEHPYPITNINTTKSIAPTKMMAAEEIIETKEFDTKKYRMTANGTLKEKKSNYRGNKPRSNEKNQSEDKKLGKQRSNDTKKSNKPSFSKRSKNSK